MSVDRTLARCSFCGQRPPEVRRMVAGPGAAYICDVCLELCQEILQDPTSFSSKALELASRPPVVIAAPQALAQSQATLANREPMRTVTLELEQKQQEQTLMLHQLQLYEKHFELHYLWIRPPFTEGFAFVPRILFLLTDNNGNRWAGDRGGMLFERSELSSDPRQAIYQGYARFSPPLPTNTHHLTLRATDPLSSFADEPLQPWQFEFEF